MTVINDVLNVTVKEPPSPCWTQDLRIVLSSGPPTSNIWQSSKLFFNLVKNLVSQSFCERVTPSNKGSIHYLLSQIMGAFNIIFNRHRLLIIRLLFINLLFRRLIYAEMSGVKLFSIPNVV